MFLATQVSLSYTFNLMKLRLRASVSCNSNTADVIGIIIILLSKLESDALNQFFFNHTQFTRISSLILEWHKAKKTLFCHVVSCASGFRCSVEIIKEAIHLENPLTNYVKFLGNCCVFSVFFPT